MTMNDKNHYVVYMLYICEKEKCFLIMKLVHIEHFILGVSIGCIGEIKM